MGRGSLTCKDCNKFKGCMERDREYTCTSFVHINNRKNKTKNKGGNDNENKSLRSRTTS